MLSAENICFRRENTVILSDISFHLAPTQAIKIVGANGSGKSTLLKILARVLTPDNGTLRWHDTPIAHDSARYHDDMLYIGHNNALAGDLTPLENLHAAAALRRREPRCAPADALTAACLPPAGQQRRCRHLSAGQQRRAALARLQTFAATLWLLDEPLTALDQDGVAMMSHWLKQHLQNGGMAICTLHHTDHWDIPATLVKM